MRNAIEASPAGGEVVIVGGARATAASRSRVTDQGPGVAAGRSRSGLHAVLHDARSRARASASRSRASSSRRTAAASRSRAPTAGARAFSSACRSGRPPAATERPRRPLASHRSGTIVTASAERVLAAHGIEVRHSGCSLRRRAHHADVGCRRRGVCHGVPDPHRREGSGAAPRPGARRARPRRAEEPGPRAARRASDARPRGARRAPRRSGTRSSTASRSARDRTVDARARALRAVRAAARASRWWRRRAVRRARAARRRLLRAARSRRAGLARPPDRRAGPRCTASSPAAATSIRFGPDAGGDHRSYALARRRPGRLSAAGRLLRQRPRIPSGRRAAAARGRGGARCRRPSPARRHAQAGRRRDRDRPGAPRASSRPTRRRSTTSRRSLAAATRDLRARRRRPPALLLHPPLGRAPPTRGRRPTPAARSTRCAPTGTIREQHGRDRRARATLVHFISGKSVHGRHRVPERALQRELRLRRLAGVRQLRPREPDADLGRAGLHARARPQLRLAAHALLHPAGRPVLQRGAGLLLGRGRARRAARS